MTSYQAFRPAFGEVIDPRYYTLDWLDEQLLRGHAHFWNTDHAALVTEFKAYPAGAMDIHVVVAAGDMRDIIEILAPQAEAFGRANGCTAATVESRIGWARALKPSGYRMHQTTIRKELCLGLFI